MTLTGIESAVPGGPTVLRGRPSTTREGWEAARAADARDLNRLLEAGGAVDAYVAPLWSNLDAERCLGELRGFDDARVYVELGEGEAQDAALAAVAESGWAGASPPFAPVSEGGGGWKEDELAAFIHAAAGLEIPVLLPEAARDALALALGEDFSPREIAAVLRGEDRRTPDPESLDHARELTPDA